MALKDTFGTWARYLTRPIGESWADFLDAILPLAAGSGSPLIGDLYIDSASNPTIWLREGGSTSSFTFLQDATANNAFLRKVAASGSVIFDIDGLVSDGSSDVAIRLFRSTNTSGVASLQIMTAAGVNAIRHYLVSNGIAALGKYTDGNYVQLSDVGLYLIGTATMWDDIRVAAQSVRPGASSPTWSTFKDSVKTWHFSKVTDQEVEFSVQLPHAWKEGSDIEPHVHWCPIDTDTGNVTWALEYTWANIDGTFGATTAISISDDADGTAYKHQIADFAAISGSGKTMSSMLVCRLYRDVSEDDYDNSAAFLEFDFHYQINSLGSKEEYVKGP